jgi:dihydropyrimidine dehydrogenase (NADP+)
VWHCSFIFFFFISRARRYTDVTIFEKERFQGGLSTAEIPQYRLPFAAVDFEARLCEDLGVKYVHGRALGTDFTVASLKADEGFAAVYLATGLPAPKVPRVFETPAEGLYTSKSFLPLVAGASKPGACGCGETDGEVALPKLTGHVVILGAGDTAFDCATSAFRCGAKRVTVVFRRAFSQMRAVWEEVEVARIERCEFIPYASPVEVVTGADGRVTGLRLVRFEEQDDGSYTEDADTVFLLKCDAIVTAFGSRIPDEAREAYAPLTFAEATGLANVDRMTGQSRDAPWVFAGGDLAGSGTTVEAVNDGKVASWHLHRQLCTEGGAADPGPVPSLPRFHTPVDDVDISVTMAGLRFPNPFGLASAPPVTTCDMIRRSFEAGWGFVVTKTFGLDKDLVTNVSPRIIRGETGGPRYGPNMASFLNIELISEKSAAYWCTGIEELVRDFPDRVVIASIMCAYNKEDWIELARMAASSGAHALELNLSWSVWF